MGNQQQSPSALSTHWSHPTLIQLSSLYPCLPGNPSLTHSINNPSHIAQYYTISSSNTNRQQQILMYRQRKVWFHNVVGVYDYQVHKDTIACVECRNSDVYQLILQRIEYRLAHIQLLTVPQIIYIFHQCLTGYDQLSKYNKLCYPNDNTIGIKSNAQIKVWINQNFADNSCLKARNQRTSVQALWNCMKMKCQNISENSKQIEKVNRIIYRLAEQQRQIYQRNIKLHKQASNSNYGYSCNDNLWCKSVNDSMSSNNIQLHNNKSKINQIIQMERSNKQKDWYELTKDSIRQNFSRQIVQGRFVLQKRLKNMKQKRSKQLRNQLNNNNNIDASNMINTKNSRQVVSQTVYRPRAYSQQLRKSSQQYETIPYIHHSTNRTYYPPATDIKPTSTNISNQQTTSYPTNIQTHTNILPNTHTSLNTNTTNIISHARPKSQLQQYPGHFKQYHKQLNDRNMLSKSTQKLKHQRQFMIGNNYTPLNKHNTINMNPNNNNPMLKSKVKYQQQIFKKVGSLSTQTNPIGNFNTKATGKLNINSKPTLINQNQNINSLRLNPQLHTNKTNYNINKVNFNYNANSSNKTNSDSKTDSKEQTYAKISTNNFIHITQSQVKHIPQSQQQPKNSVGQQSINFIKYGNYYPNNNSHSNPIYYKTMQPMPTQQYSPDSNLSLNLQSIINRRQQQHNHIYQHKYPLTQKPITAKSPNTIKYSSQDQNHVFLSLQIKTQRIQPSNTDLNMSRFNGKTAAYQQYVRDKDNYRQTQKSDRATIDGYNNTRNNSNRYDSHPQHKLSPQNHKSSINSKVHQSIRNKSQIQQIQSLQIPDISYYSPETKGQNFKQNIPLNQRKQKQEESDSKKVAQQFKYYLRSIQRSPEQQPSPQIYPYSNINSNHNEQQQQKQDGFVEQQAEHKNSGGYKLRDIYESDAPIIMERWDQEQSLSQNF